MGYIFTLLILQEVGLGKGANVRSLKIQMTTSSN